MKKNRLLLSLIFALALVLGISALDSTKVSAASKPAVTKKKVTLYTNSDPYTIEFKNLADAILAGRDIRADEALAKHADWLDKLKEKLSFKE